MKTTVPRERGTGLYTFKNDRACTCGHPLSMHTAERAKVDGKHYQECLAGDFGNEGCPCECFKPQRVNRKRAKTV